MDDRTKKAWSWLLPNEQNSLYLTLGTGKSSWEVGEMMKLSHYKYLEIKERAEIFLKMFSEFLQKHDSLFRWDGPCTEDFKEYITACICDRKTVKEARLYTGLSVNLLNPVSEKLITKNIGRLKESDNIWDLDTLELILEFDRWNNFRILPKMLQRPSAYKRRVNKKHKIYIKYLLDHKKMPNWLLERIEERFKCKARRKYTEDQYWICLISDTLYKDGYKVIPVRKSEELLKEMNKFYIYVFKEKDHADSFGFMVANYRIKTSQVRLGLKFWPDYRLAVESAINYNNINNLDFDVSILKKAHKKLKNARG